MLSGEFPSNSSRHFLYFALLDGPRVCLSEFGKQSMICLDVGKQSMMFLISEESQ